MRSATFRASRASGRHSAAARREALLTQGLEGPLVPLARGVVVAEHRSGRHGFVGEAKQQIAFRQAVEGFLDMRGRLPLFHDFAEAVLR